MQRRHLPRSRRRPHEDVLDDNLELDYSEIKDYEEAHPHPQRAADHQLGGLGERRYQAGHYVGGNAGGKVGHPIHEEPIVGPGARPPRGPNSTTDPEKVESDLEEIDESLTFLEVDLDMFVEAPIDFISADHDQNDEDSVRVSDDVSAPPTAWRGRQSGGADNIGQSQY